MVHAIQKGFKNFFREGGIKNGQKNSDDFYGWPPVSTVYVICPVKVII